jgi:MFS family permease
VTTSLVAITNDLEDVNNIGWVISSYLLGYVGVLVIFAKLSDILGRKLMMSISLFLFILFSGACGAAQNFVQLYVHQSL